MLYNGRGYVGGWFFTAAYHWRDEKKSFPIDRSLEKLAGRVTSDLELGNLSFPQPFFP